MRACVRSICRLVFDIFFAQVRDRLECVRWRMGSASSIWCLRVGLLASR